jgi:hypothetical protein
LRSVVMHNNGKMCSLRSLKFIDSSDCLFLLHINRRKKLGYKFIRISSTQPLQYSILHHGIVYSSFFSISNRNSSNAALSFSLARASAKSDTHIFLLMRALFNNVVFQNTVLQEFGKKLENYRSKQVKMIRLDRLRMPPGEIFISGCPSIYGNERLVGHARNSFKACRRCSS